MQTIQTNVSEAIASFNAIKEKIVANGVEVAEGTKARLLANKVDDVYKAGRKHEYDRMWDVLQYEGKTYYNSAFTGYSFTFDNFYPKRDIKPVGNAGMIFYAWENGNCRGDFKARLEECGVILDTSKATNLTSAFNYSHMDNLPTIDCTGLTTDCTGLFSNAYDDRKTIEKIIVKESVTFDRWFLNANGLENIVIEGVIGQSGFDIHWSKNLTAKSLYSIVDALSTTTSGLSITFPTTAEANYNANPPEGAPQTWAELVSTRSNWTFVYA